MLVQRPDVIAIALDVLIKIFGVRVPVKILDVGACY